jgi:hypothetical protein
MLAPFVYMAACIGLMRSDAFLKHTQNAYVANMGWGLKLRNADCQVLIYGDSSAMVDLDPATLQARTGLSACNIADFAGMLRLDGTMVLDEYLRHNRRPQYLVISLAPEDLAPAWRHDGNYESVLLRIRYKLDLDFLKKTLAHGEDILSAISISGKYALEWLGRRPLPPEVWNARDRLHGRFPDLEAPLTACEQVSRLNPPSRAWTDALRQRYSAGGTRVIIDVTPVPACDPDLPINTGELAPAAGIVDNQLHTYPVGDYMQHARLHMRPEGIARYTDEVAAQIEQLQHAPPPAQSRPKAR